MNIEDFQKGTIIITPEGSKAEVYDIKGNIIFYRRVEMIAGVYHGNFGNCLFNQIKEIKND